MLIRGYSCRANYAINDTFYYLCTPTNRFDMHNRQEKLEALGRVIDTLDILRVKCPWDAKQTNESLRPNTIEEVYELCDALNTKLIYRHPHVFGDTSVSSTDDVLKNWEELKLKEKGGNKTVLSGVPEALPAMIKAERITEKAANVGFDWQKREDVWEKVREEISEFAEAAESMGEAEREAEMGDVLFAVINAARLYGINSENALEKTNKKFIRRFNHIERRAAERGVRLKDMTLAEMDELWDEAKRIESQSITETPDTDSRS